MNDSDGWRWYQIDGKRYVSVTKVLDMYVPDQLKKWYIKNSSNAVKKKKEETASIGSEIHNQVHQGKDERYNHLAKTLGFETLRSEFVVRSKHGWAGQADRLVKYGGKTYLLDVKSGRFGPSAGSQMAAYSLALEEEGTRVDGIAVVSIPRDPGENAGFFDYSKNFENCKYAWCVAFDYFKFMNYKKLEGWEFFGERTAIQFDWR